MWGSAEESPAPASYEIHGSYPNVVQYCTDSSRLEGVAWPAINQRAHSPLPMCTLLLGTAGPYTNAVPLTKYNTSDPTELPTFLNPPLAICGGSSGSCLTVNEDTCCVGITSFEFLQPKVCDSSCSANYWSTISIQFPLSKLWFMVQIHLRP